MRKSPSSTDGRGRERVLARILAEDLRNMAVSGAGDTVNFTLEGGTGQKDITNIGWDADRSEV
jgi:hypothetical protein